MTIWTPLNTLLVVCGCGVVLLLCLGRVIVACIEAWHGHSAAAQASLDAIESAAERAAEVAVSKLLIARAQQQTPTPTPIIVNVPPAVSSSDSGEAASHSPERQPPSPRT